MSGSPSSVLEAPTNGTDALPIQGVDPEASRRARSAAASEVRRSLSPPPRLTVSQWADEHRYLSPEATAEPGKWSTDRVPYLREIMDCFSDRSVERVVWMKGAQVAATEGCVLNVVGYHIDQDPCPILVIQPNEKPMAHAWSKERLSPMLRDTPRLRGRVSDPKSRDSDNTILHKKFSGGHLTVTGSNSAASLASRPIRILLCDEVDKYPESAGSEGDPINLAVERTATFWNRKIGMFSTPGIKGASRIEKAFAESDQRYYEVPCPDCGSYNRITHRNRTTFHIVCEHDGEGHRIPETAHLVCPECGTLIPEHEKQRMLERGRWIPTAEFRGTAGFHLSQFYSPWVSWAEIVIKHQEAGNDPFLLQAWVTQKLGEPWEDRNRDVDKDELAGRREAYADPESNRVDVPIGVGILTAAVDVQEDRLELAVKGWGDREESWLIAHHRIYGDPEDEDTWARLEGLLTKSYQHARGGTMRIACCMIDTGYLPQEVYRFVKHREGRRVFGVKGSDTRMRDPMTRRRKKNAEGVKPFTINTVSFKDIVTARLKLQQPGPGYMHFCQRREGMNGVDAAYFDQLTAERPTWKRVAGRRVRTYETIGDRTNEAFDLEVYNLAALYALQVRDNLGRLADEAGRSDASTPGPTRRGNGGRRRRQRSRGVE